MTLKLKLREGIESFLEEENARIVQFSADHYEAAKEYVDKFGNEKIEMLRQDHGKDVADMVLESLVSRKEKLLEGIADNRLNVGLIINNNELYVPVGVSGGTALEKDIRGYLKNLMLVYNGDLKEGSINGFISFDARKHIDIIRTDDLPEAFCLSNIKFCHESLVLPQVKGNYVDEKEATDYVELKITSKSNEYGLIQVPLENVGFFPGYKKQFLLDTNLKPFVMHLNSSDQGTKPGELAGSYINHPRTTDIEERFLVRAPDAGNNVKGSFLRWYETNPVQEGDIVRIHKLGNEHYWLDERIHKR